MPDVSNHLWWVVPGVLGGMPMPFVHPDRRMNMGGMIEAFDDELPALHRAGVRALVCLLNIPSDAAVFTTAGFDFKSIPVRDGYPPTLDQTNEFLVFVEQCRWRNKPVVTYCEAGLGRTGTMLAAYLIHTGKSAKDSIAAVRAVEPAAIETKAQLVFLEQYEKSRK